MYAAFVLGLAIFVAWFGIPTDRIGLAALATGFLSIGLLGKGWRAWGRMLLDWLPFQAVLLAYDYSRGFASPYSDEQMDAHDYPTQDVHNDLGLPLQVHPPIDFDQWAMRLLGGDLTPTQWLQEHLHPGPVDGIGDPVVRDRGQRRLLLALPRHARHRRGALAARPAGVPALDDVRRHARGRRPDDVRAAAHRPARGWPRRRATSTARRCCG